METAVPYRFLMDPKVRTVTVYQSLNQVEILINGDVFTGEEVLLGF